MIKLPEDREALISMDEVAILFEVERLAMRQTVIRENWPPPMRLKRKDYWKVGILKDFFSKRQDDVIKNKEKANTLKIVR